MIHSQHTSHAEEMIVAVIEIEEIAVAAVGIVDTVAVVDALVAFVSEGMVEVREVVGKMEEARAVGEVASERVMMADVVGVEPEFAGTVAFEALEYCVVLEGWVELRGFEYCSRRDASSVDATSVEAAVDAVIVERQPAFARCAGEHADENAGAFEL